MFWSIFSWIFVALLTGINVFIFLKFKKMTEDMMKAVMPGFKLSDLGPMMMQAQKMMKGSSKPGSAGQQGFEAQMRAAMQVFGQIQKKK